MVHSASMIAFVRKSLSMLICCLAFSQVRAVVISVGNGSGNTNAPINDMGWSYVGAVNSGSGVYLGGGNGVGWVITAGHVYNDGGSRNFSINGTSYSAISGNGYQLGSIDLYVYEITVGSGTGLSLLSDLTLAGTSPSVGSTLTMIGNGLDRDPSLTTWYVNTAQNPYSWSTNWFAGAAIAQGYQELGTSSKRWGNNLSDGLTNINSTEMIQTTFSTASGHGSEVAVGDSGGGMFTSNGSGYQLSGIIDLKTAYSGQPNNTAVFGNASYGIDIASYKSEILLITGIPEPSSILLGLLGMGLLVFGLRRHGRVS